MHRVVVFGHSRPLCCSHLHLIKRNLRLRKRHADTPYGQQILRTYCTRTCCNQTEIMSAKFHMLIKFIVVSAVQVSILPSSLLMESLNFVEIIVLDCVNQFVIIVSHLFNRRWTVDNTREDGEYS